MSRSDTVRTPPGDSPETADVLTNLLAAHLESDRLPAISAHLAEVLAIADPLRVLKLDAVEPETVFDARWPDETR